MPLEYENNPLYTPWQTVYPAFLRPSLCVFRMPGCPLNTTAAVRLFGNIRPDRRRSGDFSDGGNPWKPLRGHASTVGPGTSGDDLPVHYEIRANNLGMWGISVGLKYFWQ